MPIALAGFDFDKDDCLAIKGNHIDFPLLCPVLTGNDRIPQSLQKANCSAFTFVSQ